MARVGYLYISDASCDYILLITSMLLGNNFGNKDNHTAVRLYRESLVLYVNSLPLAMSYHEIRWSMRNVQIYTI